LGKIKNENHCFKIRTQRARGGFEPQFLLQITRNTSRIFSSYDLSRETLEDLTLDGRGKNESGERGEGDGGSVILFNRAITQSQFCP
jgi:hypothetical protein